MVKKPSRVKKDSINRRRVSVRRDVSCQRIKKRVVNKVIPFLTLTLLALFILPSIGLCVEKTYTELVINPQDVGVFWTTKTQQFKAWGRFGPGEDDWDDLTEEVGWESSDTDVVTIDSKGLATCVSSWGTVDITAKFPKTAGFPVFTNLLLKKDGS